jgi:hypothetical protein
MNKMSLKEFLVGRMLRAIGSAAFAGNGEDGCYSGVSLSGWVPSGASLNRRGAPATARTANVSGRGPSSPGRRDLALRP